MKKLFIISLITLISLSGQNPNQFTPPPVPKEPISQENFQKALSLISYAEGVRTSQTVKSLPKERINSEEFFKGFERGKTNNEYKPDLQKIQQAQQTIYFYQAQQQEKKNQATKVLVTAFKKDSNKIKLDNGIEYKTTKQGTGEQIKLGDNVLIHYKGILESGLVFDDSYERGEPIPLKVEEGQVITGWIKLLPLLKEGQVIETLIPASLAYGDVATGPIPANANLFFIIELVSKQPPVPNFNGNNTPQQN